MLLLIKCTKQIFLSLVPPGNRLWGKELGFPLSLVTWSPNSNMIIFCSTNGQCSVYDSNGNFTSKAPLHCTVSKWIWFQPEILSSGSGVEKRLTTRRYSWRHLVVEEGTEVGYQYPKCKSARKGLACKNPKRNIGESKDFECKNYF